MKEVLILGNGTTRLDLKEEIASYECPIWVCNHAYREKLKNDRIELVATVHEEVVVKAREFRKSLGSGAFSIITKKRFNDLLEENDLNFSIEMGWSSGNLLILHALNLGYDKIYLAGFDFGGSDIYQLTARPGGNFKKQYEEIVNEIFPKKKDSLIFLEKGMFYEKGVEV